MIKKYPASLDRGIKGTQTTTKINRTADLISLKPATVQLVERILRLFVDKIK